MAEQFSISFLLKLTDHLSAPLIKVGQAFDNIDKKYTQAANGTTALGKKMTAFATVPIMGWAAYAQHEASKLNEAFREMGHSLEGMNSSRVQALQKDLLNMTAVVPRSTEELAEYAEMAGRMNELGDVQGFVKFMSAFTTVNKDMAGRAGVSNFMDLVRSLQVTQSEYGHTGDVITTLAQRMNSSAGAIVQNTMDLSHLKMTTKIANDELMALSAWADSFGSSGGMAMKQFTKTMSEAAQGMNMLNLSIMSKIAGFGTDTGRFQQEFEKSPAVVMQKFLKGLGQMKSKEQVYEMQKAMEQLGLSGNRVMGMVLRGAASADELGRALDLVGNKSNVNGKMMEDANEIYGLFGSQMTMLLNAVNRFAAQFGKDIKPVFTWFVDMAKTLLNTFTSLPAPVRYFVEGVLATVAVVGPALVVIGMLKGALSVLGMTAAVAGISVGAVAAPVLAVAAAVTAAVNALRVWDKYKESIMGGESPGAVIASFGKFIANDVGQLSNMVLGTNFDWFNPDKTTNQMSDRTADRLQYPMTSGAGGALTAKGEASIKIELGNGLKTSDVQTSGNVRPEINSPGYLGLRHAY